MNNADLCTNAEKCTHFITQVTIRTSTMAQNLMVDSQKGEVKLKQGISNQNCTDEISDMIPI